MKKTLLLVIMVFIAFSISAQYTTVGTTVSLPNDCFRLTQATNSQNGSVWSNSTIDLNQSFDFYYSLNFGTNNGGADGIAFLLNNTATGTGSGGGGMGYGGITTSLAIEFDTWTNGNLSDPNYDHVAIQSNGNGNHNSADNLAGPVQVLIGVNDIEDGNDYNVRIKWDAPTQTFNVYVNCQLRLTYTGNIVSTIFGGNSNVYWGFTASTGGASNIHRVCIESINGNIGGNDSTLICSGDTIPISVTSIAQTPDYIWTPNVFIDDTSAATPNVYPPVTTTYYVQINDTCGSFFDTITVEVTNQYDAAFSIQDTFCISDPPFTATAVTALGYYSGAGIIDSLAGTFHPDSAGAGTHAITHIIPGNCANDSILNVTVLALPDVSFNAPDELCNQDTITLNAATPGGIWTGTGISDPTSGVFNGGVGIGNQVVSYSLNAPCFNQSFDTIKIVQPFTPNILNQVVTLCEGDTTQIQGTPNVGSFQSSLPPTETWTGNGIIVGSNGEFDANVTGVGGPYTVYYTVEMQNGSCAGIDSVLVSVYANVNTNFLSGPYCDNDDAFTNLQPATGGGNWTVTPIAPATGNFDPGFFKPGDVEAGEYIVVYEIPDNATANGCGNISTDTVRIIAAPEAPAVSPDSICFSTPIELTALVQYDSLKWFKDPNGDQLLIQGGSYVLDEGDELLNSFPIKLYTQSFNSICSSDLRKNEIKLYQNPTSIISSISDTFTIPVDIELLNNSSTNNNETYDWNLGFYGTSSEFEPIVSISVFEVDSFIVQLITTNEFGCVDTTYKTIHLDVDKIGVWPPNIITPNGDGCNDVFGNNELGRCNENGHFFKFVTNAKDYDVLIYNRWGEKIHEFGQNGFWDGGDYPAGTYYYIIDVTAFDDSKQTFKGHLTLLRE